MMIALVCGHEGGNNALAVLTFTAVICDKDPFLTLKRNWYGPYAIKT